MTWNDKLLEKVNDVYFYLVRSDQGYNCKSDDLRKTRCGYLRFQQEKRYSNVFLFGRISYWRFFAILFWISSRNTSSKKFGKFDSQFWGPSFPMLPLTRRSNYLKAEPFLIKHVCAPNPNLREIRFILIFSWMIQFGHTFVHVTKYQSNICLNKIWLTTCNLYIYVEWVPRCDSQQMPRWSTSDYNFWVLIPVVFTV